MDDQSFPISVESVARMLPSKVDAPAVRRPGRILCGCCNRGRERGHFVHEILGELCDECALVFDPKLDSRPHKRWQRLTDGHEYCPLCLEQEEPCVIHS